jgi:hypothetical protein
VAVRRHACFGHKNVARESSPEEHGRRKAAICKPRSSAIVLALPRYQPMHGPDPERPVANGDIWAMRNDYPVFISIAASGELRLLL